MQYYEPHTDFPYEEIYEKDEDQPTMTWEQESRILNELLDFIFPPRAKKQAATCRLYACLFFLRRDFFGKPSVTQVEVAEMLGVSKQIFNAHVNEFRKRFGFYVNGMRHPQARLKFAEICKGRAEELAEARNKAKTKKNGNPI